jgi:hypothetical protein
METERPETATNILKREVAIAQPLTHVHDVLGTVDFDSCAVPGLRGPLRADL